MPFYAPDLSVAATPVAVELPPGTILWRVHSSCYGAAQFNPTVPKSMSGGRFDATRADRYDYLYAGNDPIAAVAETLLRDRPPSPMVYQVPAVRLADKKLSKLEVLPPLELVLLHGRGFPAIGQADNWLSSCGPDEYTETRLWAQALRHWAPTCAGIEYRPRHDNDRLAYIFFGDRCAAGSFAPLESYPIDVPGSGFRLVKGAASTLNALVGLP